MERNRRSNVLIKEHLFFLNIFPMAHPSTSFKRDPPKTKKRREEKTQTFLHFYIFTKKTEEKKTGFYVRIELRKSHSYTSHFATLANI